MGQRKTFSREFKLKAMRLVKKRWGSVVHVLRPDNFGPG
jgi:hypothetical protein